jgi:hypothetical protein
MTIQIEPGIGDISAVAAPGVEIEPMVLVDTTGSMTWPNEDGGDTARKDVLGEAMGIIVEMLGAEDSQAEKEKESGEDAGGLMAVTFAKDNVQKIGDLSSENWRAKWSQIRWGNGTEIMPGWNALNEVYLDEFGDVPQLDRPKMLALVITDGEASDTDAFADEMRKLGKRAYVVLAVMGYGEEHDRALKVYQDVSTVNDHIRVVSFGNTTDPNRIADAVVSLVGQ